MQAYMSSNHEYLNYVHVRSEYVMLKYAIIALIHLSHYSSKNINVSILIRIYRTEKSVFKMLKLMAKTYNV